MVSRQVAEALAAGELAGCGGHGWSIDSRSLQPGDLFFALRGPNHDGHAYVAERFTERRGGRWSWIARFLEARRRRGRILRVEDSLQALQQLAARARQIWGGRLVAVTGSAGKTTTKDIIAEMLAEGYRTAKNEGNLNNHVGLPLSLLRLDEAAQVAVLEMGMNHAGEIRQSGRYRRARHRRGDQRWLRRISRTSIRSMASRRPSAN